MRHKKLIIAAVAVLFAGFGILLSTLYFNNAPDRMLLDFLREIPLKAQKYTLAGEGGSWKVKCDRYDGVIFEGGRARLLQEITLTLDYKGSSATLMDNGTVNFSMQVDSILSDSLRQVEGADTLFSSAGEYSTIWYSASGYADSAPVDQLPGRDETLSIEITVDGKTEVVALVVAEPD